MSKFHLLLICFVLLPVGGCGLPSIPNPFMVPCRIVPECSGRITDLNGKPLPGVRVRIFSYDKISTAVSDEQGRFTLSPLYKWVGFQEKLTIYDSWQERLPENESTAGRRHLLLGELALFFETPTEHFLLLGANYFPAKYKNFQNLHIVSSYTKNMFYLCIPDWNKKGASGTFVGMRELKTE